MKGHEDGMLAERSVKVCILNWSFHVYETEVALCVLLSCICRWLLGLVRTRCGLCPRALVSTIFMRDSKLFQHFSTIFILRKV